MIAGQRRFSVPRVFSAKRKFRTSDGFTIIETLIVLAITGVLFVSFSLVTAGRQNKVRFQQAVNTVKTELEQVLSESQAGFYPSSSNFSCTSPTGSPTLNFTTPVFQDQGTNKDCIFLGKAVRFSNGPGTNSEQYTIYSLAGKRDVQKFADTIPTIIPNATVVKPLHDGLAVRSMDFSGGRPVGAVAFVSNFGSNNGGVTLQGSQTTQIVPINTTRLSDTDATRINKNTIIQGYTSDLNPATGIKICFISGTTNQSGLVTIGAGGGSNSVKLEIKSTNDCS